MITGTVMEGMIKVESGVDTVLPDGTLVQIIPLKAAIQDEQDPICGCWQDGRSAEEEIAELKAHRRNRKVSAAR